MSNKPKIKLGNGRLIGNSYPPYFIAELNTSHFGDLKLAKKMILIAKQSGADCIKLQSWTPDSINSAEFYKKNPITRKFFEKYSLKKESLKKLSIFCKKNKIDFSSTPYSKEEVNFLVKECEVAFIKIASMDLNNLDFLKYIGSQKKPIILSTGMGLIEEIRTAVKILKKAGNKNFCILHCVSLYPTPAQVVNLKNITGLIEEFPSIPIGFSDHTNGPEFSTASIALGASVIEKHFTLDKTKIGMDNQMSSEPNEFKKLVDYSKNVYISLGKKRRTISKTEFSQRQIMRRSIILKRNLRKGHILSIKDLTLKRPGHGIPADKLKKIIGKKIKKNLSAGSILNHKDIS